MRMSSSGSKTRMAMSEINITPMVDVMLVLLIIFMVTTPMMQQGIDIDLPEVSSSGTPTTDEPFILETRKNKHLYVGDTELAVSSLADTWINMSTSENNGTRKRSLLIVKSRGRGHSNEQCDIIIDNQGINLLSKVEKQERRQVRRGGSGKK